MENIKNIDDLLKKAYATNMAEDCKTESEQDILDFEDTYKINIPDDFRYLLKKFGSCNFGDPFLFSLKELRESYQSFLRIYEEYQVGGYDMPEDLEPFPIGGFGEGSLAIIDNKTHKIFMLIHDCYEDNPLEEIATNFTELMKMLANSALWIQEQL